MDLNEMITLGPTKFTDEQLAALPLSDLMFWRRRMEKSGDSASNIRLAPFEHQAFAREYVKDNPISGTLGIGASIPIYQLAKLAGVAPITGGPATPPSLKQLVAGYRGIGQGLGIVE